MERFNKCPVCGEMKSKFLKKCKICTKFSYYFSCILRIAKISFLENIKELIENKIEERKK